MSLKNNAFPSSEFFDVLQSVLASSDAERKDAIKKGGGVYAFTLKNQAGETESWHIELKDKGEVAKGLPEKPTVLLTLSDEDFGKLITGKANAQRLFMSGKLKLKGDMMKATKMEPILNKARQVKPKFGVDIRVVVFLASFVMAGNTAQEARRTLKPKSRRPNTAGSRGQSPNASFPPPMGAQQPNAFNPPAAQSFNFDSAFKPTGVNNPFTGFSQAGQDPNMTAHSQREASVEEQDMARKKPFGGFSTINTPSTTSNNIFGGQGATPGSPQTFSFGTSNAGTSFGGGAFGSTQAPSQPPTPTFFGGPSTQAQAPGGSVFGSTAATTQPSSSGSIFGSVAAPATSNTFSFGQAQATALDNKGSLFGNGGSFFGSNTTTTPTSSSANSGGVLAPSQPSKSSFTFGQTQASNQTPAKSESFTFGQTQSQTPVVNQTTTKPGSFTFGSTSVNTTASQTPAKAPSFSLNSNAQTQPPSSSGSMFPSILAPATGEVSSIFGSKPAPSTTSSTFNFGDQKSSSVFKITPSKPASESTPSAPAATSQATSSTPAPSSAPATNSFSGLTTSEPAKPLSNGSTNGDSKDQTPKPFVFGAPAKPIDTTGSEKPSSTSLFGNNAANATKNLFGAPSASQSTSSPSNTNMFNFGQLSRGEATSTQQPDRVNGFASTPNGSLDNTEPKKDESETTPPIFGQSQQPLPSSSLFGAPKVTPTQKESNTTKDSESPASKPNSLFANALDPSKAGTGFFAQKHKPVKPSPLSQSIMTESPSSESERATAPSNIQGTPQTSANLSNGQSSIFGSPTKPAQDIPEEETEQYKKEYNAAYRLRSLNVAVRNALNRMPITADVSKVLVYYETRRTEILKDVLKTKRKAVDDGTDEDGSGPSSAKRQRRNNGTAAPTSPPKFMSSGESFKENEVVQPSYDTPTKPSAKKQVNPPQTPTPGRPLFEFSTNEQSTMYGSTTPRGSPPKNVFAAQALKTPAPLISKQPPQTEKPKSTTSIFSAGTSTVPRNPPAKFDFGQSSQASQFAPPKTNGTNGNARGSSPPKQAAPLPSLQPTQSSLFASLSQPSKAKQVASSAKPQANQTSLFASLNQPSSVKQAAPLSNSQPNQTSFFSSLNQPSSISQAVKEPPKSNGFDLSVNKESANQVPNPSPPKSNIFSPPTNGPPVTFGSSSSTPSLFPSGKPSAISSSTPSAMTFAATPSSPAPNNKRKPESQLTKDDSQARDNIISTPNGKRKANSQLTKDDFEASEKVSSTPSGKRKAEVQLTKDDYESSNGINGDRSKKVNATRSETSMIFKNILDSPRGSSPGTSSPAKKMFSLNKSDEGAPRPNPFASLGVPKSPAPIASPVTTPKASAAPVPFFGSPAVKSNDAPKSLFGANNGSSTPTSLFSAAVNQSSSTNSFSFGSIPNDAAPKTASTMSTQPSTTNGFSFGGASKPAPPTSTVLKTPTLGAAASNTDSSIISATEKIRLETEKKALKDALENEYDSEDDGDKSEWIKKWKEERVAKYASKLKVPSFGMPSSDSKTSPAELMRQKTEKEALEKALVEYDSEDDGDKAEWIKKWKAERAAKAKELSQKGKPMFVPGQGFSFSSQGSEDNSPEPAEPSKIASKSIFGQTTTSSVLGQASSTDVSRTSSPGPTTSANGSVLNGQMPLKSFVANNNIFAHLSGSDTDIAKAAEDDESTDEGSEADDDEKRDPTYDPTAEPETQSPDSPVAETGPGIASAKKQPSVAPSSGTSTPKGSLFDRISKDSDGNLIRELPIENKENTQPSSPFSFLKNTSVDKTWNPSSPIKFGGPATTAAPALNFTAATPPPQKLFDFSASAKAPATVSGSTTSAAPFGNLFGPKAPSTTQSKSSVSEIGSTAASSNGSDSPTPTPISEPASIKPLNNASSNFVFPTYGNITAAPGSSLFGSTKGPETSTAGSSLFGAMKVPEPTTSGSNLFGSSKASPFAGLNKPATGSTLFGSSKPPSVFAGLNEKPAAVGFSFGGSSTPAQSIFSSAAASTSNSRATSPGATNTDNESNAPTETSNDPDAEHHEQIKLTDGRAGEEDEEILLECRAKAHSWDKKKEQWDIKGTGVFRVLKHKETGATRTLLRADPSANVVLNKGLLGNFNYQANQKSVKLLTAGGDAKGLETWLIQVKTVELAKEIAKVLEESKPQSS